MASPSQPVQLRNFHRFINGRPLITPSATESPMATSGSSEVIVLSDGEEGGSPPLLGKK